MIRTFYDEPYLLGRYEGRLSEAHFNDMPSLKVFRTMRAHRKVISGLPFTVKPLNHQELELAVEELRTEYFFERTRQHAQALIDAADKQDVTRINDLVLTPPSLAGSENSRNAEEAVNDLMEMVVKGGVNGIKLTSDALRRLDITFAQNTILTIGGISGHGKSGLAEQILLDLSQQGAMVLDITVEVDTQYRTMRYLQHLAGPDVGPKAFQEGRQDMSLAVKTSDEFRYIATSSGTPIPRKLEINGSLTELPDIIGEINRFAEDHKIYVEARKAAGLPHPGPPIVVVDFLQNIHVPGGDHGNMMYIKEIVMKLFVLTKKLGLSLIQLSQLNKAAIHNVRNNEEYLPGLNDFEGHGSIGQYTHTALFVWHVPNGQQPNGMRKVIAHFAKQRNGQTNTLEGLFDGRHLDFVFDPIAVRSVTAGT